MKLLLQQQNEVLRKIAQQHERIADAETRKADSLQQLIDIVKNIRQ